MKSEKEISIGQYTTVDDIRLHWANEQHAPVVFKLSSKSSFAFLAEGIATAKLYDFGRAGVEITVELSHDPMPADSEDMAGFEGHMLASIFGMELLYVSANVYIKEHPEINLRKQYGNRIWSAIRNNKGALGRGKTRYLISSHMYPIPEAIRESDDQTRFTSYEYFARKLREKIVSSLRYETLTNTESEVIKWLYENVENSFDHASKYDRETVKGYRGLIVQKVSDLRLPRLDRRRDLPDIIREYVRNQIDRVGYHAPVLNVITVLDLGAGIHNTIPTTNCKESSEDKLHRALSDGTTRKKDTNKERTGYGLGDMLSEARKLKALIYICSADLLFYYDFSDEPKKTIPGRVPKMVPLGAVEKNSGTSVSIVWVSQGRLGAAEGQMDLM